jgi:hypothetical protein
VQDTTTVAISRIQRLRLLILYSGFLSRGMLRA